MNKPISEEVRKYLRTIQKQRWSNAGEEERKKVGKMLTKARKKHAAERKKQQRSE